jgi:hypothetical protein
MSSSISSPTQTLYSLDFGAAKSKFEMLDCYIYIYIDGWRGQKWVPNTDVIWQGADWNAEAALRLFSLLGFTLCGREVVYCNRMTIDRLVASSVPKVAFIECH